MRELTIAGRRIADDTDPYVIAEIGNNHQGDVTIATQMVVKAKACGASAVKFQCRDNQTLYSDALLAKPYDSEHSFGSTYGAHRAALELSPANLATVRQFAEFRQGITWFATAFDEPSADRLMGMGVPAIKLASGALTDAALQEHVRGFGIPVILSTGGGTAQEIDAAVLRFYGHAPLALLHCTAQYPAQPEHANLRCIATLRKRYPETVIGFSSHFTGLSFSLAAYALGASIFEHHFTLDRAMKGTDHAFSLEPKGLETLVDDLRKLHAGLGDGVKRFLECERAPISKMRRVFTERGWQITGAL